ncbi:MAG: DUF4249 family protein [bacterium]|nr:DUF4249 family protein [bacterium]
MRKLIHRALSLSALLLILIVFIAGCETQPTEVQDYSPQPMLTAFLYNGEPVDNVILESVGSLYGYYVTSDHGISGADIKLFPVENPGAGDTLHFTESADPDSTGHYHPASGQNLIPLGNVTYRIEARVAAENWYLWAETTIPDTFTITSINYPVSGDTLDTTLTREDATINLNWNPTSPIGGYILNVTCLDTTFTPLDPDFDPEQDEIPEDSSRWSFQPVLPEYNELSIPWIHFWYQGWHQLDLQAVDQAYFDYYFSLFRVWQGAMTTLQYNVNGGLGIVGGIAHHKYLVQVVKI